MSRPLNIFRVILLISSLILIFGYHIVFTSLTYAVVVQDAHTLILFGFAVNGGFLIDVILTLLILIHIILILTMVK